MNKITLHKVSSLVLAILVLFLTSTFTVNKRFCGDFLVEATVFSNLQQCKDKVCCTGTISKQKQKSYTKNCCKETQQLFKGKEYVDFKKLGSANSQGSSSAFSTEVAFIQFIGGFSDTYTRQYYLPPQLIQEIFIRNQVFLI